MSEVVIGVGPHKRSRTLAAVDEAGRRPGQRTVAVANDGHVQALERASRWPAVRFALEGCRRGNGIHRVAQGRVRGRTDL